METKGSKEPGKCRCTPKQENKYLVIPGLIKTNYRPLSRRMGSVRSESISERCPMHLIIFLVNGKYLYLSKNSVLQHHGQTYISPDTILQYGKYLDSKESRMLEVMYGHRVNNSTIGKIIQNEKGKYSGDFVPKSIYRMTQKSELMLNTAEGITANMTNVKKTLCQL